MSIKYLLRDFKYQTRPFICAFCIFMDHLDPGLSEGTLAPSGLDLPIDGLSNLR